MNFAPESDSSPQLDPQDGADRPLSDRPWDELRDLVSGGDPDNLESFFDSLPSGEIARAISRLDEEDQTTLMQSLSPEVAAGLIEEVSDIQAADLIERLPADDAAAIFNELESDQQADLLVELSQDNAEAILAAMDPEEASQARQLAGYEPETGGGLMITEYLRYTTEQSVQDVLDDLRANAEEYADYDVQYAYVVSDSGTLQGVLRLRDLLLSRGKRPIAELMIRQPHAVRVEDSLDHLAQFFDRHHFFGVPVVESDNRLVGVIRKSDVEEALAGRADVYSMELQGIIGGEELRTMPVWTRSSRRLAWLAANVVLNLVAVSVIAVYEDTLAAVISLAVFLPLISDMGGNAGVQAIAVSIRELSLGLLKPHELLWVAMKEASVGVINGIALGLLVGIAGWLWQQNAWLGLVVGGAMAINTVIAVIAGGLMPLVLKRFGADPALAAGPLLTTVTDMSGFFLVLSFATAMLSWLVP